MHWLALHFPHFALEILSRGHASPEPGARPLVIAEAGTVFACAPQAEALGVHPGMTLSAAWVRIPQLRVRTRRPSDENTALEGIGAWMCRFTPRVSIEPTQGIVAEVEGSLRLFGGLPMLAARVRAGLRDLGFGAQLAAAPTASGACWLARSGEERLIEPGAGLDDALDEVPATLVCDTQDGRRLLQSLGLRTVGALRALPRAALARRFGPGLPDALDRAFGRAPELRRFFTPPARFSANLELPAEVTHAEGLLFAARRLLLQLEGLLVAQQAGVRRFELVLFHRRVPPCRIEVGLASPGRDTDRLLQLLRERLAASALVAPVHTIRLGAGAWVPFGGSATGLFRDARIDTEAAGQLIERLQARLGNEAVHGLGTREDHRPERAWRRLAPGQAPARGLPAPGPRPLWLLEPPRALREVAGAPHDPEHGALELLAGPERIEAGWWDGEDVTRDYFIARAPNAACLWIFRHPGGAWYLHGLFA